MNIHSPFFCLPSFCRLLLACLAALHAANAAPADTAAMTLVDRGRAASVIVVQDAGDGFAQMAAEELQREIQRASKARLPIVTIAEAEKLQEQTVRIVIGGGPLAAKLGVDVARLAPEEYRVKTSGNHLILAGHDTGRQAVGAPLSRKAGAATLFAVSHFLDRELGVRWLWPGELGTHVPRRSTIAVGPLDVTAKPALLTRNFSVAMLGKHKTKTKPLPADIAVRIEDETMRWWGLNQLGGQSPLQFGHAFMDWWEKYAAQHPDYFAKPPAGEPQVPPDRVKLCTSNPAVIEQVLAEWKAAGAPDAWNICPNDGKGFCTCDRCRALDDHGPLQPADVWVADADLSRRHFLFANEILRRMKAVNPRVTLCTYAYSCYRNVPAGMKAEPGLAVQFVHSYTARDAWNEWTQAGAKIGLRPNWLHTGAVAPWLPLHTMGGFLRHAQEHGMIEFHHDSLMGHWATQGPNYYLIARIAARPDLSVDDIIGEWCSAFGPAAPDVRRYLDYWEAFTEATGYTIAAGGIISTQADSRYEKLCREHDIPTHPVIGSWRTMPLLYTDDVLAKAEAILHDAEQRAGKTDPLITARIQFLRDGLRHLQLTRDVIALAYADKADAAELARKTEELETLRAELSPRHVICGEVATGLMQERSIKPYGTGKGKKADLKGL